MLKKKKELLKIKFVLNLDLVLAPLQTCQGVGKIILVH